MKKRMSKTLSVFLSFIMAILVICPSMKAFAEGKEISIIFDFNGEKDAGGNTEFVYPYLMEGSALGGISAVIPQNPHRLFKNWSIDKEGRQPIEDPYEFIPYDGQRIYANWIDAYVVTLKPGEDSYFDCTSIGYSSSKDSLIDYFREEEDEYCFNVEKDGSFGLNMNNLPINRKGLMLTGWKSDDGKYYMDEDADIVRDVTFTAVWGTTEWKGNEPYVTDIVIPEHSVADFSFTLSDSVNTGGNDTFLVGDLTVEQFEGDKPVKNIKSLYYWKDHENGIYYPSPLSSGMPKLYQPLTVDRLENPSEEAWFVTLTLNYPVKDIKYNVTSETNVYRLYNKHTGEHFYTSNKAEYDSLGAAGWSQEEVGFVTPAISDKPIYRMYNPNAGDHHYTMNYGEVVSLIDAGWNFEGVTAYSGPLNNKPVYKLYNPNAVTGTHHFTENKAEYEHLAGIGWVQEGIAWYTDEFDWNKFDTL